MEEQYYKIIIIKQFLNWIFLTLYVAMLLFIDIIPNRTYNAGEREKREEDGGGDGARKRERG